MILYKVFENNCFLNYKMCHKSRYLLHAHILNVTVFLNVLNVHNVLYIHRYEILTLRFNY